MLQSKSTATRVISIAVIFIFLFVSIFASTESVAAATKLKVTASKKAIYVGQTVKFKANKNVKWSVSSKKVAKLTKIKKRTVTVKGLKAGTVYVKAKAGKKYKKIKITVRKPKKLTLTTTKDVIGLGDKCSVNVLSVKKSDVSFSSSDSKVATVSSRGLVEGQSPGLVTITAVSKTDKMVKGSIVIEVVPARAGTATLNVDLSDPENFPEGKVTKLWLPVPQSDEYQSITRVEYDAPDATAELTTDSDGGKQLYIEWSESTPPEKRKVSLSYHLYRRAAVHNEAIDSIPAKTVDAKALGLERYLEPTYWSGDPQSGIIKETADEIVKAYKAETVYEKAFAIYDWMCDNLTRYDDVSKPLKGEIPLILESMKANTCIEVSAVFSALCRAEGIPARCLYGLRFINANGIPSVNCRAEFYLPEYGWVSADPALAIKQSWGHESEYLGPNAPERALWEDIKDKYWVNAEENWICLNKGHDVWLDPKQETPPGEDYLEVLNPDRSINYYALPYAEYDGQYVSVAKYKFGYDTFIEEDPLDCGCL